MGRVESKKAKKTDPYVLKQCAQHPEDVHLNGLTPAASKRASKLREDCIFL